MPKGEIKSFTVNEQSGQETENDLSPYLGEVVSDVVGLSGYRLFVTNVPEFSMKICRAGQKTEHMSHMSQISSDGIQVMRKIQLLLSPPSLHWHFHEKKL